jgi:phage shock protein PspC (stress-responsive transcriptional regulator)
MTTLSRPLNGRVIAGVCAAIARRFGWDVTTVRVLTVLSFLLPGTQLIAYLLLWVLIPSDSDVVRVG